jgi:hypothetical protein
METNFVALVGGFKFERRPTFILTCDAVGLRWLRDGFLTLMDADRGNSFIVGNGTPIASDDLCKLTVVKSRNRQPSKVLPSVPTDFEWHVDPADAATYADQLSSLLLSDIPGHQYLDVQRGNYRTVVVTKLEYPVDTIRAMRDGRIPAAR